MNNPNDAVRRSVRAELARRGLRQVDLAQALGMTQQGLSRRLGGSTPFTIDELVKIAAHMDLEVSVFLADVERVAS